VSTRHLDAFSDFREEKKRGQKIISIVISRVSGARSEMIDFLRLYRDAQAKQTWCILARLLDQKAIACDHRSFTNEKAGRTPSIIFLLGFQRRLEHKR
jgi:hypothetical protein